MKMDIAILKFTVFALGLVIVGLIVKPVFSPGTSWTEDRAVPSRKLRQSCSKLVLMLCLVLMKGSLAP